MIKTIQQRMVLLLTTVLVMLIPGCGGGSHGTGTLTIEGRVLNTKGRAIQSANITNLETGAATITSNSGNFSFVTEQLSGELSFLIETKNIQVTSRGGGQVPDDANVVDVQIVINTEANTPSAKQNVVIRDRKPSGATSSSSSKSSANSSSSSSNNSSSSSSSSQSSDDGDDDDGSSSSSSTNSGSSSSSSSEDDDGDNEVRVEGAIQNITTTTITVKGTSFTVDNNTDYDGHDRLADFSVGENVEVRGRFKNQILIAERVKLKD